jgi:thymidylate synthase (FAD)
MVDKKVEIGSSGFVRLVETMPMAGSSSLDSAIVQAARISTGAGLKTPAEDNGLIRYLMRNKHTSPFEMVELKFHLKMPIFVARQWMRHRMASINEYSGRYTEVKDECFIPKAHDIRTQSSVNKQGSDLLDFPGTEAEDFVSEARILYNKAYAAYTEAIDSGIAREQARMLLPQSMYTEFYWKIDLHNFMNFVRLRADKHAQFEIQTFAKACSELVKPLVPATWAAFEDYTLNAITLSGPELECFKNYVKDLGVKPAVSVNNAILGKSELLEFEAKLNRMSFKLNKNPQVSTSSKEN